MQVLSVVFFYRVGRDTTTMRNSTGKFEALIKK